MKSIAIIYITITVILWGFWGYFGKLALLKGMKPHSVFLAETIFGLFFGIIFLLSTSSFHLSLKVTHDWNIYGILSGIMMAIGLLSYYLALNLEEAHIVIPLTAIYPIIGVMLSVVLLNESINFKQAIGVILTIIGVILLLSK